MESKLVLFCLVVFISILVIHLNNRSELTKTFTLLALGDSYTIGEGVPIRESFPYQLVQMFRAGGYNCNAPEIIAQTGWTSNDLRKGIRGNIFQPTYRYVTLLIGVNDQYQGKSISDFAGNFEILLRQAITFAANESSRVFVLSIPNWAQTPFAAAADKARVTAEIIAFNESVRIISAQYKVQYFHITNSGGVDVEKDLLAPDLLHPSGREYARWANLLYAAVLKQELK